MSLTNTACPFCGMPPLNGMPCCKPSFQREKMRKVDSEVRALRQENEALRASAARTEAALRDFCFGIADGAEKAASPLVRGTLASVRDSAKDLELWCPSDATRTEVDAEALRREHARAMAVLIDKAAAWGCCCNPPQTRALYAARDALSAVFNKAIGRPSDAAREQPSARDGAKEG